MGAHGKEPGSASSKMLPMDTQCRAGTNQNTLRDYYAHSYRWRISQALGIYSSETYETGNELETRAGADMAERNLSSDS